MTQVCLVSVTPDSLSLGEESEIVAFLSGNVDGITTGIEGKWIYFQTLNCEADFEGKNIKNPARLAVIR